MQVAISIYLLLVVWLTLFVSTSTFLLSSECPAPPPCTCSGSSGYSIYIRCDSKSLTAVPQFGVFNASLNYFYIYLSSNSIISIPNNAFRNLSSIKADSIIIDLNNNYKLNTIESNAFVSFENVTNLQLNNNNFTIIPAAISTLKQLQYLSMLENPLKSLDHSVLSSIGHTLISFEFDVGQFTEWPAELRYLTKLQTLTAIKIPYSHLDAYAFHGFENTLTSLTMNYAKLEKVPHAICQLTRLTIFVFRYDSNLNENKSSIFDPCGHMIRTVTHLYLEGNNLHIFPDAFSLFPSLTYLYAGDNKFEYIDSSKIPSTSHLTSISLNNNLFERIPPALYKLKFLTSVNLNNNKIKIVEIFDLNSLSKLQVLYLDYNPLVYIASGAFSHNPEMNQLYLQNTQLEHIPQDVTHLTNLIYLYLSGRPIECTCDMSYLKHWNVSAVTYFSTPCASSTEIIKTYIMTSLQSCP